MRTIRLALAFLLGLGIAAPCRAADIAAATWSQTDASNNSASPAGAPEGMAPSGVNDTIRANMGAVKRWHDQVSPTVTSAGTNTITLTYAVAPTAYVTGDCYTFFAGGTNTGAATGNVNALGAKSIVTNDGAALTGYEITINQARTFCFDGTNLKLLDINQQLVANPGHMQFMGGLILQAGSVTFTAESTKAVTFPRAFPNAILSCQTTIAQAALSTIQSGCSPTLSSFDFNVSTAVSTTGFWTAVGY